MRVRGCALIENAGKLLVLVYEYPGGKIHAIPGGGVAEGETLAEAVVREYREELGLEIEIGSLRFVGDMPGREGIPQTLHVVFDGLHISGTPLLNPKHTSAKTFAWLDRDALKNVSLYPAINEAYLADVLTEPRARYLGNCMAREWV